VDPYHSGHNAGALGLAFVRDVAGVGLDAGLAVIHPVLEVVIVGLVFAALDAGDQVLLSIDALFVAIAKLVAVGGDAELVDGRAEQTAGGENARREAEQCAAYGRYQQTNPKYGRVRRSLSRQTSESRNRRPSNKNASMEETSSDLNG
jgi:hypothetical protein